MLRLKQTIIGIVSVLFLLASSLFVLANVNLDVQTPVTNSNLTGLADINFTFSGEANYTIEYQDGSGWSLLNASDEVVSPVTVVWNTTAFSDGLYNLTITAVNATNNSYTNTTTVSNLLVDNSAPVVENRFFNTTIVSNESELINLSFEIRDEFSVIDSVLVGHESLSPLTNVTAMLVNETIVFEREFNATQLNCDTIDIICPISLFVNDSLGNTHEEVLFTLLIDTDTPIWSDFSINPNNIVRPGFAINLSTLWNDHSLNVSQDSFAELFKNNNTHNTSVDTAVLNNESSWSNFTYTILEEDLVDNLSFFITYTDLVGRTNTTDPIQVFVDDSKPTFVNVSVSNSTEKTSAVLVNGSKVEDTVIISESISNTLNISFVLNESFPNSTTLFKFTDSSMNNPILIDELGAVTNGSFLVDASPGVNQFTLQARDQTFLESGDETNLSFTVLYNPLTNVSAIRERLENGLTSPAQSVSLQILQNNTDISSSTSQYLNGSIGFNLSFESDNNNFFVEVSSQNGLEYFWNNSFSLTNSSQDISVLDGKFNVSEFWLTKDYTLNFSNSVNQKVNWTITTTNENVLLFKPESKSIFSPKQCDEEIVVNSLQDSCYERDSENNITRLFTYGLGGVILGNATGAPNITNIVPEHEEEINNSFFNFRFDVIDFEPVQEGFCSYNITQNNNTINDGFNNLSIEDFTLNEFTFSYSQQFTELLNDDNYSWSITCFNEFGLNTTIVHNFTVNDTIAPSMSAVDSFDVTTNEAIISASSDELAFFRVYYSTSKDNLSSTTSQTESLQTSFEETLTGLLNGRQYYFLVEACDINNNCANHSTEPSSFDTQGSDDGTFTTGGSGGGATSGVATSGSVDRTHSHSWDVLRAGLFNHTIRDEQIPIAVLRLTKESDTNDAFVTVRTFDGRPAGVSELANVYKYVQLEEHGLDGSSFELDFRVPHDSDLVRFFRYENGEWVEYAVEFLETKAELDLYTVRLPGFSFFAITIGDDSEGEAVIIDEPSQPEEPALPQEEEPSGVSSDNETQEDVIAQYSGEESSSNVWMTLFYVFFGVLTIGLLIAGGFYAYNQGLISFSNKQRVINPTFDENDPFYDLHVFINDELNKNSGVDEIKEKLVSAGWDDLIVDEEITRVMSLRV